MQQHLRILGFTRKTPFQPKFLQRIAKLKQLNEEKHVFYENVTVTRSGVLRYLDCHSSPLGACLSGNPLIRIPADPLLKKEGVVSVYVHCHFGTCLPRETIFTSAPFMGDWVVLFTVYGPFFS